MQLSENSVHVAQSYLKFMKIQGGPEPHAQILF